MSKLTHRIGGIAPKAVLNYRRLRRWYRRHLDSKNRVCNIAMFHIGRCGSTATSNLIHQHPGFHWGGEIFENMSPEYYAMDGKLRAHQRVSDAMYTTPCQYYGFETKYLPEQHIRSELANMSLPQYLELLQTLGFSSFILLQRRNYLKQAISTQIGYQTKQWSSERKPKERPSVTLNPHAFVSYGETISLLDYFQNIECGYNDLKELLYGRPVLELIYEDHIEYDSRVAYRRICEFLNLNPVEVVVRLQRQNPWPLTELLKNYSEVADYLNGSEYEWMLAE